LQAIGNVKKIQYSPVSDCPDHDKQETMKTGATCSPTCENGFTLYGNFQCGGNNTYTNPAIPECIASTETVITKKGIASSAGIRLSPMSGFSSDTERDDWRSAISSSLKSYMAAEIGLPGHGGEQGSYGILSENVEAGANGIVFGQTETMTNQKGDNVDFIRITVNSVSIYLHFDEQKLDTSILMDNFRANVISDTGRNNALNLFKTHLRASNPYLAWNKISELTLAGESASKVHHQYIVSTTTSTTTILPDNMHCRTPPDEYFKVANADYSGDGNHQNSCESRVVFSNSVHECPKDTDICQETQCEPLCLADFKMYGKFTCTGNQQWSFDPMPQCVSTKTKTDDVLLREGMSSDYSFALPANSNHTTAVWKDAIAKAFPKTVAKVFTAALGIAVSEESVEIGTVSIVVGRRRKLGTDTERPDMVQNNLRGKMLRNARERQLAQLESAAVVVPFTVYTETANAKATDIAPGFSQLESTTATQTFQNSLSAENTALASESKMIQDPVITPAKAVPSKFEVLSTSTTTTKAPAKTTTTKAPVNQNMGGANPMGGAGAGQGGQGGVTNPPRSSTSSTGGNDGSTGPPGLPGPDSSDLTLGEFIFLIVLCLVVCVPFYEVGKMAADVFLTHPEEEVDEGHGKKKKKRHKKTAPE